MCERPAFHGLRLVSHLQGVTPGQSEPGNTCVRRAPAPQDGSRATFFLTEGLSNRIQGIPVSIAETHRHGKNTRVIAASGVERTIDHIPFLILNLEVDGEGHSRRFDSIVSGLDRDLRRCTRVDHDRHIARLVVPQTVLRGHQAVPAFLSLQQKRLTELGDVRGLQEAGGTRELEVGDRSILEIISGSVHNRWIKLDIRLIGIGFDRNVRGRIISANCAGRTLQSAIQTLRSAFFVCQSEMIRSPRKNGQ